MKNEINYDLCEQKKKIIIIDDDDLILNSIKKQLKNENYFVEYINNPIEGIKKINEEDYNLVICDVKMKPIQGIEVLKLVKELFPDLPVIIITGYVDDKIIEEAKKIGCSDFLIKPLKRTQLINSINNVLR